MSESKVSNALHYLLGQNLLEELFRIMKHDEQWAFTAILSH